MAGSSGSPSSNGCAARKVRPVDDLIAQMNGTERRRRPLQQLPSAVNGSARDPETKDFEEMTLTKENKAELISKYGKSEGDTGSTEVRGPAYRADQRSTGHLREHGKRSPFPPGPLMMVGKRRCPLRYLSGLTSSATAPLAVADPACAIDRSSGPTRSDFTCLTAPVRARSDFSGRRCCSPWPRWTSARSAPDQLAPVQRPPGRSLKRLASPCSESASICLRSQVSGTSPLETSRLISGAQRVAVAEA